MANARRNQEYLGIDSNVLIAYLIPDHPAHDSVKLLARKNHAVNPTVLHETYHTSVFKLKRKADETVGALLRYMRLCLCLSATDKTVKLGLKLALSHRLGGRDALILATYILSKEVGTFMTMDSTLLALGSIKAGNKMLTISPPPRFKT